MKITFNLEKNIRLFDGNNIVNLKIHGVVYRCVIFRISKSEALYILKNSDLSEKKVPHY